VVGDDLDPVAGEEPTVAQHLVVLTERALSSADAERLVALHDPDSPTFRVLVPAGGRRNVLVDVLDHLSLLEFREAVEAVGERDEHVEETRAQAQADVDASVTQLQALDVEASGEVVDGGDPIGALAKAVQEGADEVVVVTSPHAVEDTLHRDWASVARERLGVPVLHVYAGSDWLG
jgi:hypothetical protein